MHEEREAELVSSVAVDVCPGKKEAIKTCVEGLKGLAIVFMIQFHGYDNVFSRWPFKEQESDSLKGMAENAPRSPMA